MAGIIRTAKRPDGWIAPGPAPRGAQGEADLFPEDGEDLCFLSGDWRIFQRLRGHRWSLDDLVTAWSAQRECSLLGTTPQRILDLGCGIGSVLLMLAWKYPEATVLGVEAQTMSASMARRSIRYNGAIDRVQVLDGDLRDEQVLRSHGTFPLITGTPPYFLESEGVVSEGEQKGACRFELRGDAGDYARTAARVLAPGGRFVVCVGAVTSYGRVALAAKENGLRATRMVRVIPREGKDPLVELWTFAHDADATAGAFLEETLLVRDRAERWTDAFRAVRTAFGIPA